VWISDISNELRWQNEVDLGASKNSKNESLIFRETICRFSQNGLRSILADEWDRQIESDVREGRLDEAVRNAEQEIEAGQFSPL
jgi:hypothetical protein